jgi:hypothetical protein
MAGSLFLGDLVVGAVAVAATSPAGLQCGGAKAKMTSLSTPEEGMMG